MLGFVVGVLSNEVWKSGSMLALELGVHDNFGHISGEWSTVECVILLL